MRKNLLSLYFNAMVVLKSFVRVSALCIALSVTFTFAHGQAQLLKDINSREDGFNNEYSALTDGYDKIYFINNATELWKTTGNAGGTVRLKAFNRIGNLTLVGTTLYFSADDGSGMELWKSTGTLASTVKVKEFVPGTAGGLPEFLTNVNGTLYFAAYTTTTGKELWKTDGTESGTVLVKDILRVKGGSNPGGLTNVNGTLYFSANDGKNGYEIWKSDGTTDGTVMVKDVRPGGSSTPNFLTNVNGTLFFVAFDGISGRELWKSNGTESTTMLVRDIRAGSGNSVIENLTAVNNTLFFTASDGIHGFELWKSDGSEVGTALVKDMTPGSRGSHGEQAFTYRMGNFKSVFGLLYYTAYQNETYYIWKSDGTEAGTVPLHVSSHNISQPTPRFVPMGNYIYYFDSSEDERSDNEFHLYRMNRDGSNPVIVATLFTEDYYSTYNPELIALNNTLYFDARDNQAQGFKLFRSNGSPGSMVLIKDIHKTTLNSEPYSMVKTGNNKVFFVAEEEEMYSSPSLWRTDGTPGGTIELQEFDYINAIVATSTHVYYSLNSGLEIWKSDGTPEGTVLVMADPTLPAAYNLVTVNDMVYFQSYNAGLWRTDGTEAGTISLPGTESVWYMKAVGNLLLFTINRGYNFVELWRSNGTATGTYRIYSFPGKQQPSYTPTAVLGNVMFFVADDGISGNEVWRTDGTAPGTYRIADLHSQDNNLEGPYEYDIRTLAVWKNNLYISAFDDTGNWALYKSNGASGNATKVVDLMHPVVEIIPVGERLHFFSSVTEYPWYVNNWVTDGTKEGTNLLGDLFMYTYWSFDYTIVNNVLYYNAYEEDLLRSDGTNCGTFPIDLGVFGANPMENIGSTLVFRGLSSQYGSEPFVYNLALAPKSPCGVAPMVSKNGSSESLMVAGEEGLDTPYPNPFTQDFSFRFNGSESDVIHVAVYTSTGFPVEHISDLKANTDYRLGTAWPVGFYILNINTSGKITSQKMIKK